MLANRSSPHRSAAWGGGGEVPTWGSVPFCLQQQMRKGRKTGKLDTFFSDYFPSWLSSMWSDRLSLMEAVRVLLATAALQRALQSSSRSISQLSCSVAWTGMLYSVECWGLSQSLAVALLVVSSPVASQETAKQTSLLPLGGTTCMSKNDQLQ